MPRNSWKSPRIFWFYKILLLFLYRKNKTMGKWITRKTKTEYIDSVTGEVVRTVSFEFKRKEYELYMKAYLENIIKDNIVYNQTESAILAKLQFELKHSSSMMRISSSVIKELASYLDLNKQSIYNAINRLCELKVLIPIKDDIFHLNPKYYWNGLESDKLAELNMILDKLNEI